MQCYKLQLLRLDGRSLVIRRHKVTVTNASAVADPLTPLICLAARAQAGSSNHYDHYTTTAGKYAYNNNNNRNFCRYRDVTMS